MSFVKRLINLSFALGEGAFGESGSNSVELSGLRVSAKVIKAGGPSMGTVSMRVYGMTLSQMNKLSTLGMMPTLVRRNTVTITAGDKESGMGTVFIGTITNAWADFAGAPDVPFHVEAHTGLIEAVAPAEPTAYRGSADVAVVMAGLATRMGIAFENNGVSVMLSNPYFPGSARDQAKAAAEAAGIEWIIDNGKLAIWNAGQARGSSAPLISPETGMKGYPSYTSKGIMVGTLFNPSIGYGGKITVKSSLEPANGEWVVYKLDHDLDSLVPKGAWFSNIEAARVGLGPVVA